MKKLIFTTLSLIAVSSAFAQRMVDNTNEPRHKAANDIASPAHQGTNGLGKSVISDWYSPLDWFTGAGAVTTTYVNFIMPDSLCKYIDEDDTTRRSYNISFGQVFDPKDDNIDLSTNPGIKMTRYTGYSLDSVGIVYLYVRNVDQKDDGNGGMVDVVDTMVVNYFKLPSGMRKSNLGATGVFAVSNWDIASLSPTGQMIATQKIPLTRDDSTSANNSNGGFENSWSLATKTWAPPVAVNIAAGGSPDNIIAVTIGFKLGHSYDSNNVMIYQRDPVAHPLTAPRANYFGYRFNINEGATDAQIKQLTYYSNSQFATITSAYGTNVNNWDGFIPGNAFFQNQYANIDAWLTTVNSGINDINNDVFAMSNVYPNPATVNGTAVMAFNLKNAGTVNVSIYNIAGQLVKTTINKNFTAGEHAEEMDLTGLKAGIYMVNMTVNGASVTKKLTITE